MTSLELDRFCEGPLSKSRPHSGGLGLGLPHRDVMSSHGTQAPRGVFRTPRDLRAGPVFAVCLLQETGGPAGSHLLFPQPRLPRVESAADGG